jgi:hypothetical protein
VRELSTYNRKCKFVKVLQVECMCFLPTKERVLITEKSVERLKGVAKFMVLRVYVNYFITGGVCTS